MFEVHVLKGVSVQVRVRALVANEELHTSVTGTSPIVTSDNFWWTGDYWLVSPGCKPGALTGRAEFDSLVHHYE